eukprot:CFRG6630T1
MNSTLRRKKSDVYSQPSTGTVEDAMFCSHRRKFLKSEVRQRAEELCVTARYNCSDADCPAPAGDACYFNGLWVCVFEDCGKVLCHRHRDVHAQISECVHSVFFNPHASLDWCYLCDVTDRRTSSSGVGIARCGDMDTIYRLETNLANSMGKVGLVNMGNTCYLNAAMQALMNCDPFVYYIQDCYDYLRIMSTFEVRSASLTSQRSKSLVLDSLADLVEIYWGDDPPSASAPRALLRDMANVNRMFNGYSQHDSQEFIGALLDRLHEETFRPQSRFTDNRPLSGGEVYPPSARNQSMISDLFEGTLRSQVTCLSCGSSSFTFDPFMTIPIEIGGASMSNEGSGDSVWSSMKGVACDAFSWMADWTTLSLTECLERFCEVESLNGGNRYRCTNCNDLTPSTKSLRFHHLPEVLVICLKRFSHHSYYSSKGTKGKTKGKKYNQHSNSSSNTTTKTYGNMQSIFKQTNTSLNNSTNIDTTTSNGFAGGGDKERWEYLKEMEANNRCSKYNLTAVVNHSGGLGNGHYISYARHFVTNEWFKYDDSHVEKVTEDDIKTAEGYVLFYQKDTTHRSAERLTIMQQIHAMEMVDEITQPISNVKPTTITHNLKCEKTNTNLPDMTSKSISALPPSTSAPVNYLVARTWFTKWLTVAEPGPITNTDVFCDHGGVTPQLAGTSGSMCVRVPSQVWNQFVVKYGGGPAVTQLTTCVTCERAYVLLQKRRKYEIEAIRKLHVEDTRENQAIRRGESIPTGANSNLESDGGECLHKTNRAISSIYVGEQYGDGDEDNPGAFVSRLCAEESSKTSEPQRTTYYMLPVAWMKEWTTYTSSCHMHVQAPGPIDTSFFTKKETGEPKTNMRNGVHYDVVGRRVWRFFYRMYGCAPGCVPIKRDAPHL